jgi:hypothetical protein
MYWHHPSGIYRLRRGDAYPREISRPIQGYIDAVSRSYYKDVSSWSDDDHVYFSVGNVTVDGKSVVNCVLRWTISTEVWTVYSYAMKFVIGATYDNGTSITRLVGDDDGNVYTFDSGTTDNGTPIYYELETPPYTLTGLRSDTKIIKQMSAIHDGLPGTNLFYRPDELRDCLPIGQLGDYTTTFKDLELIGKKIRFSVSGQSSSGAFSISGFEITNWITQGILV